MKIIHCEQGGEDWFRARAGKVTASEVIDALSFLKKGEKKGGSTEARKSYMAKLIVETLTGEPDLDGYLSQCMKDGTEFEPIAREVYAERAGVQVVQAGFIVHPTIARFGCSPDGIVGPGGGVELKSPKTKTHLEYMLAGILPPDYEPQVMSNIACAEAEWWDFASFGIKFNTPDTIRHQLFTKRVYRDDARIKEIEDGVRQFLQEMDDVIGELERINPEISMPIREQLRGSLDDPELGITDEDIADWMNQHAPEIK